MFVGQCEVTLSAAARLAREARVERLRELEREAGGSTGSFRALPIPAYVRGHRTR